MNRVKLQRLRFLVKAHMDKELVKEKLLALVALLCLSLILTACGASKKTATINVELLDVQFRPDEFTVPAGAEVTFTATNYGLAPHNFIIFKKGFDAGGHFGHEDEVNIYWRLDVAPGKRSQKRSLPQQNRVNIMLLAVFVNTLKMA